MSALCRTSRANLSVTETPRATFVAGCVRSFISLLLVALPLSLRAASPQIDVQPVSRSVIEGTSHTFEVTASGTAPLAYQWRKDGSDISGGNAATLALTAIQTSAAGFYSVVVSNGDGAVTSSLARLTVRLTNDPVYPAPPLGWTYNYQGVGIASSLTAALDGTWNHESDSWSGDGRGVGNGLVGGVSATNGIMTIEDGVTTTTGGTFNNRRFNFLRNLVQDSSVTNAATLLDNGVTLTFRARLTPASDPWMELTNAPHGLVNNADAKGMFSLRQTGGGGMIVSFSLNQAVEDTSTSANYNFGQAGLHMNHLNGNFRTNNVDPGETGTLNLLPLDPTAFHEFWITIEDNGTNPGTHRVSIYLDGALTPATFNVTAGTGTDLPSTNYLALGMNSTTQRGAVDVDFFGYKPGVILPASFNQPVGIITQPANQYVASGQAAHFTVGVTGTPPFSIQWYRDGAAISGATNSTYTVASAAPADEGASFTVTVANDINVATSAPPAELHLLGAPIITAQPQSLTVTNGDTASLSVTASSSVAPTYQWRRNGIVVGGATSATLAFSPAGPVNDGAYDVVISNDSGSVTSTVATLTVVSFDFGDAPNSGYLTLRASDGARHRVFAGVHLGTAVDVEADGLPGVNATGDDSSGTDDEDGVTFPTPWVVGQSVSVTVVASTNGFLSAWVDWNQDGNWAASGDQVITNATLVAGTNVLAIVVPGGAASGAVPARFRFDSVGGLASSGPAVDGEVEDYLITVSPRADLSVALVASANPVGVTSNLTFTVALTNLGPSLATGVMLTNALPAGANFVGVSSSQGSCFEVGGQVVCDLGNVPVLADVTVAITVKPVSEGAVSMTSVAASGVIDPVPGNNSANTSVTAINGPSIVAQPVSRTVTNGTAAAFFVTASGTAPLAYQWFRSGSAIVAATNASFSIAAAQLSDEGGYTVRVTNLVGAIESAVATLTVLVPPAIATQPVSLTNLAGSTATFSVGATGSEPLYYNWRFNGVSLLADEELTSLVLVSVQLTNAGAYSVVVSNAAGVVTSAVANLTVVEMDFGDAPAPFPSTLADNGARHRLLPEVYLGSGVDFEPDAYVDPEAAGDDLHGTNDENGVSFATTLRIGQTVNLQVVASTNGFLNAWVDFNRNQSWAQAGEQVFTNRALVVGTNSLSFPVPGGASVGQTFARFRFSTVQNLAVTGEAIGGEVEDYEVTIESVADVAIASLTQSNPVVVGSNQVYSVVVSNAGPAVATGVSLSDALPAGTTFVSATAGQGACVHSAGTVACSLGTLNSGATVLVTITVVAGIEGVVANTVVAGANQVDLQPANNSATISANALLFPAIVSEPVPVAVTNGGTANFAVTATGTAIQYQWKFFGTNLVAATNSTLTITNVQLAKEGPYTVFISNAVGSVTSVVASLSILHPVGITAQPQSITVLQGGSATFAVTATGTGPFAYQWTFNGADIVGQTAPSLVLTNVQTNHVGAYQVRVGNILGTVTSSNATLNVLVPPFFTTQPVGQTNPSSFPRTVFSAAVAGTAPIRLQWYFNQTNLLPTQTNTTLTLTNVLGSNAGIYSVVASNVAGVSTSAVVTLAVFDMDFGDAPATGFPSMLAVNGARHRVVAGVRLGAGIDAETNGLPNASASGDDNRITDDEDGVFFPLAGLPAGLTTLVQIVASTNGFLEAWIDFNGNSSWADAGEQVATARSLVPGTNLVPITVPVSASSATRNARFRFCTSGGISFEGLANDGEVEDHQVIITPSANLVVGMIKSQDPVPVSSNVTYTISVTNRGATMATLVWVTNPVPAAVTFVSYATSGGQGFCDVGGGVVYCLLDDMPQDAGATVDITLRANATGTYTNRAWAFSVGVPNETSPADNTNFVSTAFIGAPVPFVNPGTITVADANGSTPGKGNPYPSTILVSGLTASVFKVTVTLSNVVHEFAKDLDILLVGPRGQNVMLMSDAGASGMSGSTLGFDDGAADPLPSSGAISAGTYRPSNYGFVADVFPTPGPAAPFGASLSVFSGTDPNGTWSLYVVDGVVGGLGSIQGGWSLEITTADPIADLALTATGSSPSVALGSNLVYAITVTNRGPAVASQVRLTNGLPAGVTFVSASGSTGSCAHVSGIVACDLGVLAAGAGASFNITVAPGVSGLLTNAILVAGAQSDLVVTNNAVQIVTLARPPTDLAVSQVASTNLPLVGQGLTYTLSVTNRGPNAATNVRVTDVIPATAAFVSAVPTQGACSNFAGTVVCNLGALVVGGSAQILLAVSPTLVGLITNSVSVLSDEIDSNATNNNSALALNATVTADLGLLVAGGGGVTGTGQVLTHLVGITNRGPNSALNALLTHTLPPGAAFVSATSGIGSCELANGTVRCLVPVIDAFTTVDVSIRVSTGLPGTLTNQFTLLSESADFVPTNNAASTVVTVLQSPAIVTPPQGGTFTNGNNVTLTVLASGTAPLEYQWQRDGVDLPGATASTFALPGIAYANRGDYRVRVSNAVGVVTSAVATVVVRVLPVISDVADQVIDEDQSTGSLAFTIADEDSVVESLTVTAESQNTALVPASGLVTGGIGGSRTVWVTPVTNATGITTITIRVTDSTGLTAVDTFTVTVNPVNDQPTVSNISDIVLNEDSSSSVGVTIGDVETAAAGLVLSVTTDNPEVVSTNGLRWSGTDGVRTLAVEPVTNAFGSAIITVTVADADGLIANDSFVATVVPVNDTPQLDDIPGVTVVEDSGAHSVGLSGINSGATNELQVLQVSASSGALAVVTNVSVNYTSPGATATLTFDTFPNASGTAQVSVTLTDNGTSNRVVTKEFTITVLPVNDAPQIGGLNGMAILEDAGLTNLLFTVLDAESPPGALQVFVRSLNPGLILPEDLSASGNGAERMLTFQPAANQSGSGLIEVAVVDPDGGAVTNTVEVVVLPVNDLPTISALNSVVMNQDTVSAPAEFTVGDVETPVAVLDVAATASDEVLFPAGSFAFGGNSEARTLVITPAPGRHGVTTITVRVTDAAGGVAESSFTVTVREIVPLSILVQPVGRTVTNGVEVSFSVTAASTLPITFQWTFNGLPLADATNAVLTLQVVSAADAGTYRVAISNAGGTVTSLPAVLRVLVVPRIEVIAVAGGGINVTFPTVANLSYTLEYSDGAEPLGWTTLTTVEGTGGDFTVHDPSGSLPVRLYRVRAE